MGGEGESSTSTTTNSGVDINNNNNSGSAAQQSTIPCKSCPIDIVTVFSDRADVSRIVTAEVPAGPHEIVISGLPTLIDQNSLRVDGIRGDATILEVSYSQKDIKLDPSSELAVIKEERKRLEKERRSVVDEESALIATRTFYESYASNMVSRDTVSIAPQINYKAKAQQKAVMHKVNSYSERVGGYNKNGDIDAFITPCETTTDSSTAVKGDNVESLLEEGALKGLVEFLGIYRKVLAENDEKRAENAKKQKEIQDQINALDKRQNSLGCTAPEKACEVSILVQSKSNGVIVLRLSYIVSGAKWVASYDIRGQTNNFKDLSLTYHGEITQSTTEDWTGCRLALSTAQPSIGGAPPPLSSLHVQLASAPVAYKAKKSRAVSFGFGGSYDRQASTPGGGGVSVLTATAEQGATSTTFLIPRKVNIKSDNKPHKVTITVITLASNYSYETVPHVRLHAYLKASVINTSEFPLLPGQVSIFLDNAFVSQTSLKAVAPNEGFEVFLGSDPSIKVDYRQEKYKETGGVINKVQSYTVGHVTTIKNNKDVEIEIRVKDLYPRSGDEKIKVKLLDPAEETGPNHKIDDDHHMNWTFSIPPQGEYQFLFSYIIEWPAGKTVDLSALL
eukprot:TRINITY_DN2177_c0_g2_i1.p1 TRINITY_DN2177_c0_g2~~TRINITY_DN2177_c0_g2_i1.p1  ORF type:complete len:619 (+),score=127.44 TRINITY_DN2177_c0_g2_i1:46-1902(+)